MSELLLDIHNALQNKDVKFAGAALLEHFYDNPDDLKDKDKVRYIVAIGILNELTKEEIDNILSKDK